MHADCPISSSLKLQPVERESAIDPLEAGYFFPRSASQGDLPESRAMRIRGKGQKTELGPFSSFR